MKLNGNYKEEIDMANNTWIEVHVVPKPTVVGYERSKTVEEREKEKLKYWSNHWKNKNHIKASSCIW